MLFVLQEDVVMSSLYEVLCHSLSISSAQSQYQMVDDYNPLYS